MALALITLAVLGPLPALLVDLVPIAVGGLIRREQLLRAGNLANVAAYGWKAIAAAALLVARRRRTASPPTSLPWLLLAAAAQLLVNWAVGPAIYAHAVARPPVLGHGADARRHRPGRRADAHARRRSPAC